MMRGGGNPRPKADSRNIITYENVDWLEGPHFCPNCYYSYVKYGIDDSGGVVGPYVICKYNGRPIKGDQNPDFVNDYQFPESYHYLLSDVLNKDGDCSYYKENPWFRF